MSTPTNEGPAGEDRSPTLLERVDEATARALTGRCSWFCGDVECPEACVEDGERE